MNKLRVDRIATNTATATASGKVRAAAYIASTFAAPFSDGIVVASAAIPNPVLVSALTNAIAAAPHQALPIPNTSRCEPFSV